MSPTADPSSVTTVFSLFVRGLAFLEVHGCALNARPLLSRLPSLGPLVNVRQKATSHVSGLSKIPG